jgi:hypothetical protein
LLVEERFDRPCRFDRLRHHEQMSVIYHLQSGIWNEPRQNAAIDEFVLPECMSPFLADA